LGNREAFEALVRRYSCYVESLVRAEMGPHLLQRFEPEDLVQESLIKAFQSIGSFRGEREDSFRNWLSTIARRVVQYEGRLQSARLEKFPGEISLYHQPAGQCGEAKELGAFLENPGKTPFVNLLRDERFNRLKDALGSLSPEHREVILRVRVQKLPVKEVAWRMGRSPNATSVLLFRALLKLREAFGHTESYHLSPRSLEEEAEKE